MDDDDTIARLTRERDEARAERDAEADGLTQMRRERDEARRALDLMRGTSSEHHRREMAATRERDEARAERATARAAGSAASRKRDELIAAIRKGCEDAGITVRRDPIAAVRHLSDMCRGGWANAARRRSHTARSAMRAGRGVTPKKEHCE